MTDQEMEALVREISAGWHETDPSPYVEHNENKLAEHILAAFKRVAADERDRIAKDLDSYFGNGHDDEFLALVLDRIKSVPQ